MSGQQGVNLLAPNSAVATFNLGYPTANQQALDYVIEFSPEGLNAREAKIGALLNRIQTNPPDAFAPSAAAIIAVTTVSALGTIYQNLTGKGNTSAQSATLAAVTNSTNDHERNDGQRRWPYVVPYLRVPA